MSEVALLNPSAEAELARRILTLVEVRMQREEQKLLHTLLDREEYLRVHGAMVALRDTLEVAQAEYKRNLHT